MEVQCEGASGAIAKPPTRLRRGETSCNKKDQHRENKSFPILVGRAHLARQYVSGRMCSWGALLRERKVTGRDASLPAPLLSAFSILVARGTVGALPQTPQGTLSLDPARGKRKGKKSPLDPFSRLSWSLFLTSSACCSDVPPIHPHTKPRGLRFSHRPRGFVYPITSAYKVRHSHSRRWSAYRPASHPRQ